jgi:hypothetical protein
MRIWLLPTRSKVQEKNVPWGAKFGVEAFVAHHCLDGSESAAEHFAERHWKRKII